MHEYSIQSGQELKPQRSKEWWGLGLMVEDEETMSVADVDYADYEALSATIDKAFGFAPCKLISD